MAIPKPREKRGARQPRARERQQRSPLPTELVEKTEREAAELLAKRERNALLLRHWRALGEAIDTIVAVHGEADLRSPHAGLVFELQVELMKTHWALQVAVRAAGAAPGEDMARAVERLLAELGASAYQIADVTGAERRTIDNRKRARAAALSAELADVEAQLAEVATATVDLGDGPTRILIAGPHPLELKRDDINARIARLTVDRKHRRRG